MVFIRFRVNYRFDNPTSENNFNIHYANFKARNHFDMYQSYSFWYHVPDLVERKTFYAEKLECQYFHWYLFCGIIGFLWCISIWI